MRNVLVTGAAGGLGACVCDRLAASGDTVFAADAAPEALRSMKGRPGIVPLRLDVTSTRDVARARKRIEELTNGLDGLVGCAGIFRAGALVEADEEAMAATLDINVLGAFRVVRAFFPLLAKRGGLVVLIGSESSRCAMPFNGPYTVSKCALQAYADVLRRELAFLGMRVAVIQPGAIRTPLLSGARSMVEGGKDRTRFPAQMDMVRRMLAREWEKGMEPDQVARVVVRALRARRPRAIYRVGNDPLRAMLGMVPAGCADLLIRTVLSWPAASCPAGEPPVQSPDP